MTSHHTDHLRCPFLQVLHLPHLHEERHTLKGESCHSLRSQAPNLCNPSKPCSLNASVLSFPGSLHSPLAPSFLPFLKGPCPLRQILHASETTSPGSSPLGSLGRSHQDGDFCPRWTGQSLSSSPSSRPHPAGRDCALLTPPGAQTQRTAPSAPPHTARASPETAAPAGRD